MTRTSRQTPIRRLLARGLLALAFVFAQQTAALHWLSHAIDATHAKSAASQHCDECLVIGALGAGAPAATAGFAAFHAAPSWCDLLPEAPLSSALRLAFRSRAPPVRV